MLAPADAQRLGIDSGDGVRLRAAGRSQSFVARLDDAMHQGVVGLVQGMTGPLRLVPGAAVEVSADPDHVPPASRVIVRG